MPAVGGTSWVRCLGSRGYPLIGVEFLGGSSDKSHHPFFFDTGARENWIAGEYLRKLGIRSHLEYPPTGINRYAGDAAMGWSQVRRDVPLHVSVSVGGETRQGEAIFNVVQDWYGSSFDYFCSDGVCEDSERLSTNKTRCGSRVGLISTRILEQIGIAITLDGPNRLTLMA